MESTVIVSPLKSQAAEALRSAGLKWQLAIRKVENVFNKSNRIVRHLVGQTSRRPSEVTTTGIELPCATALSHFFNTQFGINERAPELSLWLSNSCGVATPAASPQPGD